MMSKTFNVHNIMISKVKKLGFIITFCINLLPCYLESVLINA